MGKTQLIIVVAFPPWNLTQLRDRVKDSITRSRGIDDQRALDQLLSRLLYVSGDYGDPSTFTKLKEALRKSRCPPPGHQRITPHE